MQTTLESPGLLEPIRRLSKDLRNASKLLDRREARYLVDCYYQLQDFRIQMAAQIRASTEDGEPNQLLQWMFDSMKILEAGAQSSLGGFAKSFRVGAWLQSICGIGPVISAGLLAHLDIRRAPFAGNFWSFAGMDPSVKWMGGKALEAHIKNEFNHSRSAKLTVPEAHAVADSLGRSQRSIESLTVGTDGTISVERLCKYLSKRPWNASLKTLCWKIGESFIKVQNNKNDYYGKVFARRKAWEIAQNLKGANKEAAEEKLKKYKIGKTTTAYEKYSSGLLPDAHVNSRARRYAVKLFLSHLHHVMYEDFHGVEPPEPYGFNIEGHGKREASYIAPPDWPGSHKGKGMQEMYAD